LQVVGAGGGLGLPARPGGNFGGKTPNLGAAPHDWGFAKKKKGDKDQEGCKLDLKTAPD